MRWLTHPKGVRQPPAPRCSFCLFPEQAPAGSDPLHQLVHSRASVHRIRRAQARAPTSERASGATGRILKYAPDGTFITESGRIGTLHGEFRTPHALEFDSWGRLWVPDRGHHRLEIFDQDGNYLESRYMYGRISGIFITDDDMVYAIDSESGATNHPAWANGVRIGHIDRDLIEAFVPTHPADTPRPGRAWPST